MDKYFIFVDENVIQGVLVFTTGVILSIVVALLCEKYFHFKYGGFFIVLWIFTRSCVGQHIANEDKRLFINSRINSVIIEHVEWVRGHYRNKLRNGMTLYSDNFVSEKDSIVKEPESNSYDIYKYEYPGTYTFAKRDTVY